MLKIGFFRIFNKQNVKCNDTLQNNNLKLIHDEFTHDKPFLNEVNFDIFLQNSISQT